MEKKSTSITLTVRRRHQRVESLTVMVGKSTGLSLETKKGKGVDTELIRRSVNGNSDGRFIKTLGSQGDTVRS